MNRRPALAAATALLALAGCATNAPASPTPTSATTAPAPAAPASASTSAGTAAPSVPAGVPELIKTYCTATQKLCFHYPIGFTIKSTKTTSLPAGGEDGSLLDPQGKPVLYFGDGMSGMGGSCDDSGKQDNTVVNAAGTKISGLPAMGSQAATADAVQAVVPRDGKFIAHQFLSGDTRYAKPGTVKDCGLFYADLLHLGETKGDAYLSNHEFSEQSPAESFATVDEARASFSAPAGQLVAAILQTATLG